MPCSQRTVVHDRGVWEHGANLSGKAARHIRVVLRNRRELKSNQRFGDCSQRSTIGLDQEGFAGAIDIVKVGDKKNFCSQEELLLGVGPTPQGTTAM
jgi:hypothetical protein